MIYECPQCGDVFQTDVPVPVCDNCGGPMRETVGDFDPETGALWHVWRMDPIDARLEANRLWQELREVATALGNVGCPTPQMDALRNDLTARLRAAADDVHALVAHPSTARRPKTPALEPGDRAVLGELHDQLHAWAQGSHAADSKAEHLRRAAALRRALALALAPPPADEAGQENGHG